jgi:hypothetical protein
MIPANRDCSPAQRPDLAHADRLSDNSYGHVPRMPRAECHSTGVQKNYDAANDRFATSFAEISVGCEALEGLRRHLG